MTDFNDNQATLVGERASFTKLSEIEIVHENIFLGKHRFTKGLIEG
jgi:hypothetical protein